MVFSCAIPLLAIHTESKKDMTSIEKGLYQPKQPSAYPGWGTTARRSNSDWDGHSPYYQRFSFLYRQSRWHSWAYLLFVGIALVVAYCVAKDKKRDVQKLKLRRDNLAKV